MLGMALAVGVLGLALAALTVPSVAALTSSVRSRMSAEECASFSRSRAFSSLRSLASIYLSSLRFFLLLMRVFSSFPPSRRSWSEWTTTYLAAAPVGLGERSARRIVHYERIAIRLLVRDALAHRLFPLV